MSKKFESKHFEHDVVFYVPCFQANPRFPTDSGPTFRYSFSEGSVDYDMVAMMAPDYILTLKGRFDAKTQPFDYSIIEHNFRGTDDCGNLEDDKKEEPKLG